MAIEIKNKVLLQNNNTCLLQLHLIQTIINLVNINIIYNMILYFIGINGIDTFYQNDNDLTIKIILL